MPGSQPPPTGRSEEMDFFIRPLDGKDSAVYRELRLRALKEHPEAFATSYSEEQKLSLEDYQARLDLNPQQVTHGAFDTDQLLGFSTLIRSTKNKLRHRATLVGLYVVPGMRGRGIANALLETALESARIWKVSDVALSVTLGNHSARRLYRKRGFLSYGVEPRSLYVEGMCYDVELLNLRLY